MTEERTTQRPLVLTALLMAMFMSAIESTIVATAMPSIAAELGGFSLYSWVFSSFLLMQAVTIPICGKLSDVVGRKPVFVAGVLVFLAGSVLCGFARTMGMLVAFRFLQGLGAGALQPVIVTLAGDLYTLEERGRVQGYISGVWGFSAIAGPLAGGFIVHGAGWPWIFWMNLPFGIAAIALVTLYLHERVGTRRAAVDYGGAALLLAAVGTLMVALTQAGTWPASTTLPLLAASALAFVLFARRERRAPDPLMHLELWTTPLIRNANLASLTAGIMMIGVITFLPTFVQGVLGGTPLQAGFSLSVMIVGWPLASYVAGHLIVSAGVRRLVRAGGAAAMAGTLLIALLAPRSAIGAGAGSFLLGVGLGFLSTTTLVAIQASVSWSQRGVATASTMLMRILGNALGAALFGGVLNWGMSRWLARTGLRGRVSLDSIQDLMGREGSRAAPLAAEVAMRLRDGLSHSLQLVFWGIVVMAAVTLAAALRIPELERSTLGEEPGS